jgi:hypothetical protein
VFPVGFEDLERFAGWALPTERERNARRMAGPYEEIKELYDQVLARLEDIFGYLNPMGMDLPAEARRLADLTLMLAELGPAVEFYQQPEVVDGFGPEGFVIYQ